MDGATFGQYRVTGVIGRGGMGAVYAAEHTLLGRPAAIKVLLPELSQKQDIVQRFFNEARAATAIRHPSIVEIYDFGWTGDGAAFLVMELLEGEALARRSERMRLRWQAALGVVRQIAGALAAAHAKGIVHRDLKPENVFLVPDPEVPGGERIKLLDFGIAKLAGDVSTTAHVTRTGAVMGTPTYMAPEQCRGVVVDHRADLYALGCVLFQLCTGRPPFIGEGTGDVLAAHIHVPPPTLASLQIHVPQAVEHLVQRLLAKSPEQRVQTAEELIRAIDLLTTERGAISYSSSGSRPLATSPSMTTLSSAAGASHLPAGAPRSQRRTIALICTVAAAITVVVVALAMRNGGDASPAAPVAATVTEAVSDSAESGAPARPAPAPVDPAPAAPGTPAGEPARGASGVATDEPAPAVDPAASPTQSSKTASTPPAARAAANPSPATSAGSSAPPAASVAASASPATTAGTSGSSPAGAGASAPSAAPPPASPTPPRATDAPSGSASGETIEVMLDSIPEGAQVLLGRKLLGTTPFRGTLPRKDGTVRLVIRRAGYADGTLEVRADKDVTQRVELVRARAPKRNRDQSVNPFAE